MTSYFHGKGLTCKRIWAETNRWRCWTYSQTWRESSGTIPAELLRWVPEALPEVRAHPREQWWTCQGETAIELEGWAHLKLYHNECVLSAGCGGRELWLHRQWRQQRCSDRVLRSMVRPLQEPGTQVQGAGREGESQNQDVLDYLWLF